MTTTADGQQLSERCQNLFDGAADAVEWVTRVRADSQRLERESDSLIDKLRRVRNLSRRLGRAATRPVAIGFFGLSQAGKSYLISALAADGRGELGMDAEGMRLDFIAHVNPPGGGKEATGLVTRFTRSPSEAPPGYPLELALFSEVDLVKVLGNTFLNDFDRELTQFDTSPAHIRAHLKGIEPRRRPAATGGLDEDAVVELLEYFEHRFPKTTAELKGDYWPTAIELAPYLKAGDRAELFSVLWGQVPELTAAYLRLREALERTGFAESVYCPVAALVAADADGVLTQADSIMNVDILERLGRDDDDRIEVRPRRGGHVGEPVALPRSLLAALTAELKFALAEPPRHSLLEDVDLLDFPGYRGRLAIGELGEVRKALDDDQVDPVAQLILRGKVAYLFERYTDDQEMNALVLCAPCHKQSDVKDLGPVLQTWIHATQGADPEVRGRRKPGLIWAITMFDFRLAPVPGQTVDLMRKGWEGMMKLTLLERFGAYNWVNEWSPGRPFDNIYLVRKPRMAAVIESDDDGERRIMANHAERLDKLRATFCEEKTVQRHIQDPCARWDAMLALNDGGISPLAETLCAVAKRDVKLTRIGEQIDNAVAELVDARFGPYYQAEGAAEVARKEALAARLFQAVSTNAQAADRLADLMVALYPDEAQLAALYLRTDEGEDAPETPAQTAANRPTGGLIDLGSILGAARGAPTGEARADPRAVKFARAVIGYWIGHLRALAENDAWLAYLGLPKDLLEDLCGELITGADRIGLERSLVELVETAEVQTGVKRSRLVDRQVYVVRSRVARFVDQLTVDEQPPDARPRSLIDPRRELFAEPMPIAVGDLPQVPAERTPFSATYVVDWLEAFKQLAIANAGYAAGREISAEENARLGAILERMRGATTGSSA